MLRNIACCATGWPCMVLIDNLHNLLHKIRTVLIFFVQHCCCATRFHCEWWGCTTCVNWNPIVDIKHRFLAFSGLHSNANTGFSSHIHYMRDEHYGAQNSTKIVQPRGNVNRIIFLVNSCCTKHFCATWLIVNGQTCVAQNIFAQHDWSRMGPIRQASSCYFDILCHQERWGINVRSNLRTTILASRSRRTKHYELHHKINEEAGMHNIFWVYLN
jgi:hypothetical protein